MKDIIRFAKTSDAEELLKIYSYYILNTSVTFEYDVPDVVEFSKRIENISLMYPYLVYVSKSDGKIKGYAYAHRAKERAAYQWNAELSVYIDNESRGQGIGTALYTLIINILKHQNIQNLYAVLTLPNEPSQILHEKCGFIAYCLAEKSGYKFNQWHDVIQMVKFIGNHEVPPKPFVSIKELYTVSNHCSLDGIGLTFSQE